jgi:hypothetical protein
MHNSKGERHERIIYMHSNSSSIRLYNYAVVTGMWRALY